MGIVEKKRGGLAIMSSCIINIIIIDYISFELGLPLLKLIVFS